MRPARIGYGLVAALLLAGCATTGDPRSGGLFGWREEQARERRLELESDDEAAQARAADEQARGVALRERHDTLDAQAQQLQRELARLEQENRALDARLRALLQRRHVAEDERRRLKSVLEENQAWLMAQAAAPATPAGDVAGRRFAVDKAGRRNDRLRREIIALLQD